MIHEIARLTIHAERAEAFEAAVEQAIPYFRGAAGCLSMKLERVIEEPSQYLLIVGWTSLEAHEVDFRGSPGFQAWRGLVGEFFAAPPQVQHTASAISGF